MSTVERLRPIRQEDVAGTCPACDELVHVDEPDGPVWTCPADLGRDNRHREPCLYDEDTVARWEREGYYGLCGEDVGLRCHERMPLHSDCYDRGNY